MNNSESEKLAKTALKSIAEHAGIKHAVLMQREEDTVPSTGIRVFRFTAAEKDRLNEPGASVVLDASGAAVDLAALGAAEGKTFFRPHAPGVPDATLAPLKIRIDPPKNDLRLGECDRIVETVTVTIPKSGAVSKADVYFLADTTGSMESILAAVKAGASSILAALAGLGLDLAYGVGNYKDFPSDPYAFKHQLAPTAVAADVQNAISAWSQSGGGDTAEGQLFALDQLAEAPAGAIGWRTGSKRIIVWFGDAPGHDPVCKKISGLGYDITEASATAKLASEKISVIAIGTDTGVAGALDADPVVNSSDYAGSCGAPAGSAGQGTRIANATGGKFVNGINAATIVTTIVDLVKAVVGSIDNVSLVADAVIAPFVVSIAPAAGYGPLPGDKEHVLKFEVVFSVGDARCASSDKVFVGALDVLADGIVVARKPTRITIPACKFVYSVKYLCGVQQACDCECAPVRPGVYATEINIHNYKCRDARLEKWMLPLVLAGAAIGREPRTSKRRLGERIVLPADSATMDDCCRITELLLGAPASSPLPLSIGFMEIVSDVELQVTAVYTASDAASNSLSMDVATVAPRLK